MLRFCDRTASGTPVVTYCYDSSGASGTSPVTCYGDCLRCRSSSFASDEMEVTIEVATDT
ncbi:uncharacterized protein EAF01_008898 [Botrytis porri]|uniref:uncharacterized protein n=1 Tax=Botrytis porri TaxID=87229 RepID=UPI001902A866|nr:uncharacterized protein EAF01_008898 [Botrytis porri]KAF7897932.1 hypothetical protein EAF01_008898 [Botrytis porri]